jgi:hypothetical protein
MHYKNTLFTQQLHEKSGILLNENYIALFCQKKKLFDNIILTLNMHGILPKEVEITI